MSLERARGRLKAAQHSYDASFAYAAKVLRAVALCHQMAPGLDVVHEDPGDRVAVVCAGVVYAFVFAHAGEHSGISVGVLRPQAHHLALKAYVQWRFIGRDVRDPDGKPIPLVAVSEYAVQTLAWLMDAAADEELYTPQEKAITLERLAANAYIQHYKLW